MRRSSFLASVAVATVFLASVQTQARPAPIKTEEAACDVAKARVAARGHFLVSAIAFCDLIVPEAQPKGLYVLGLHGKRNDCRGDVCGSTLMGWFAVQKATGRVFEWDFTDFPGKLGKPVRAHH